MLTRTGDFEEWELAQTIKDGPYIKLYAKPGDNICYVPYLDLPTNTKKFVKFAWLNEQWIYVDNDQNS